MTTTTKLKRFIQAISVPLLVSLVGLLYGASQVRSGYLFAFTMIAISIISLISFQTYFEYKRRTYDPTLVLKYQDIFDGMVEERKEAARAILEDKDLVNIEAVLDFLEDLGFYLDADQLSSEVIHHHFYYWIRLYLDPKPCQRYIEQEQKEEPARWDHLAKLLDAVSRIELSKQKKAKTPAELKLSEEKLQRYLAEERDLLLNP